MENSLVELNSQKVMQVLFMVPGTSVEDACHLVGGIKPDEYRMWVRQNPEFIDEFRIKIQENQREILNQVAIARMRIIERLVDDSQDPDVSPLTRLAIEKRFKELQDELMTDLNAIPGREDEASAFLKKGPRTMKQPSRFTASARLDIETGEDGDISVTVYKPDNIIDGELLPSDSESDTNEDNTE